LLAKLGYFSKQLLFSLLALEFNSRDFVFRCLQLFSNLFVDLSQLFNLAISFHQQCFVLEFQGADDLCMLKLASLSLLFELGDRGRLSFRTLLRRGTPHPTGVLATDHVQHPLSQLLVLLLLRGAVRLVMLNLLLKHRDLSLSCFVLCPLLRFTQLRLSELAVSLCEGHLDLN